MKAIAIPERYLVGQKLQQSHLKWGAFLDQLITHYTLEEFIAPPGNHEPNSIKVVEWTTASPRA
jgi:hypothetical protein